MALIHQAELHPTKLELLAAWLPTRGWYADTGRSPDRVASYRYDDPAGAVGIETMLVRAGDGPSYQVPLTYRGEPLEGGEAWLIGTMDHSVLGKRWVYDACGDPVFAAALAGAILTGAGQADEFVDVGGRLERREPSMTVTATDPRHGEPPPVRSVRSVTDGDPTVILADAVELAVIRRLDGVVARAGAALTGTWPGQPQPLPLAYHIPAATGESGQVFVRS